MTDTPKIDGKEITMGGAKWIVPPLNLRLIRKHREKIKELKHIDPLKSDGLDQMEIMIELIHGALQRNYPEITPEAVEEMVDVGNVQDLMMAILSSSGLVKKAAAPGEAPAGEPQS